MLLDIVDSYYTYVQKQMAIISPSQAFGSVVEAADWPQTPPIEGALYLVNLNAISKSGTESQNFFEILVQWSWYIIGQDIQSNQQGENRGSRHRQNWAIMSALRQASYPSFCPKIMPTVNMSTGQITLNPVQGNYQAPTVESVYWSKIKFVQIKDKASGLIFGAGSLKLYGYDDILAAVA